MKVCTGCSKVFDSKTWECPSCRTSPSTLNGYLSFASELQKSDKGFDQKLFEELAPLEEFNFWFRSRNRLIIWALRKYFPTAQNFCEIGCGTGYVLSGIGHSLPHMSLFGSEIFTEGLDYSAKRIQNATLFQMDARNIPFIDEFDVIGAFDVLEHISDDVIVLQQMFRAVRPNGGIILTVPQHQMLWSKADEFACHVRRYDAEDLKEKLLHAGFHFIRATSFVTLLLPLMIASRLMRRRKAICYDPLSELKLSRPVNVLFEKCLDLERFLIRHGLDMCIGGSLLLIAKKL